MLARPSPTHQYTIILADETTTCVVLSPYPSSTQLHGTIAMVDHGRLSLRSLTTPQQIQLSQEDTATLAQLLTPEPIIAGPDELYKAIELAVDDLHHVLTKRNLTPQYTHSMLEHARNLLQQSLAIFKKEVCA